MTQGKEHAKAANNGNWHHLCICQHKESCSHPVDGEPKVITTYKNKKKLTYDVKVREAFEIRCRNCGPGHGLNEDLGAYVRTLMWNPVFQQMNIEERVGANP